MADDIKKYTDLIRKHLLSDYEGMYREPVGPMEFPFISPGSTQYDDQVWDWDSWLCNISCGETKI